VSGKRDFSGWRKRLSGLALACAGFFVGTTPAKADPLLLWEVTGGAAPIWLFGSVHLCRADCFPLPPAVESRFTKADVLAVELDATRPDVAAAMTSDTQPGGNLKSELTGKEWAQLKRQLAPLRLPESSISALAPNIANLMVSLAVAHKAGLSPLYGIDLHFIGQAQQAGKRLVELETIDQQIHALNAGTRKDWLAGLRNTMTAADDGSLRAMLEEMVAAWRAGDAPRLARAINEAELEDPSSKALFAELFDRRNREMSESIAGLARRGESVFVVVGSGHLAGADSIPAQLAQKGFKVRQLSASDAP
jgi:uncharacterized protein YbaP (TraB family)